MHNETDGGASTIAPERYDFRKDFSSVIQSGLKRYLESCGWNPDAPINPDEPLDDCWEGAKVYVCGLWRALRRAQEDCREFDYSPDLDIYGIKDWTREGVQAYIDQRLEDILQSNEPVGPIDIDKSVERAIRMAATAEGGPSVAPAAVLYATERLKSKVRRDAVVNPVSAAYVGLMNHAHLGGGTRRQSRRAI
jgi:hypothetical protein